MRFSNKYIILLLLYFIPLWGFGATFANSARSEKFTIGQVYKINIDELHPTQLTAGFAEVELRAIKFANMGTDELREFRRSNPAPVVLGPNNQFYMIDRHHAVLAYSELAYRKAYVQVVEDFSQFSQNYFWSEMQKRHWLHLYDEHGNGPLPISKLPKKLSRMKDDPYRSLSAWVRRAGGFEKEKVPFAEFYWAHYFRKKKLLDGVNLKNPSSEKVQRVVEKAVTAAKSLRAKRGSMSCSAYLPSFLKIR